VEMNQTALTRRRVFKNLSRNRFIYMMVIPVVIYLILFRYQPMWFMGISLFDYRLLRGFSGSKWVGFAQYIKLFSDPSWLRYILNTLWLNFWAILILMPAALIFALLLNELYGNKFKLVVQTISYLPHFISSVVVVSLINTFVSPSMGILASITKSLGMVPINYIGIPKYFVTINIISGLWQCIGWDAVIYIASLSSIDRTLYEAAVIDGADRWQQTLHITIPGLMPTFVILLIIQIGQALNINFEKVYLLQNNLNLSASEMLPTFVYKVGMVSHDYSFASAAGVVNSLLSVLMVFVANHIAKRVSDISLF